MHWDFGFGSTVETCPALRISFLRGGGLRYSFTAASGTGMAAAGQRRRPPTSNTGPPSSNATCSGTLATQRSFASSDGDASGSGSARPRTPRSLPASSDVRSRPGRSGSASSREPRRPAPQGKGTSTGRVAANLKALSGRRSRSNVSTKNNGLPSGAIPNSRTDAGSSRHRGCTTT
jgi:hypothetical protein